jgi:dihydroorotate dehydrogenase (fumarate)
MHLVTTLADIELEHPLMNAAGTCKNLEIVKRFARSAVSAITVGSITYEARLEDEGQNRGRDYYREHFPAMVELAHGAGKPLAASVAGFSPVEYGELAQLAHQGGVDLIELNLGYPSAWNERRIASFDPGGIAAIVSEVEQRVPASRPVGVKLSQYSDSGELAEVAETLKELPIRYVATSNRPVVGLARMSGVAMKPTGLGQIEQLRQLLPDAVQLIGVGVTKGGDVCDYLQLGASAVQVSTAYWSSGEDPGVFGDILSDYVDHRLLQVGSLISNT